MPIIGYGVYLVDPSVTERCVLDALSVGYRSLDTAQYYENEAMVGSAVRKSGIPRDEIFITSKLCLSWPSYAKAKDNVKGSLHRMGLDYLDLMLIHWPMGNDGEIWAAFEDLVKEGYLRSIGVSNFYPAQFDKLVKSASIIPAVNQIETHVFYQQRPMIAKMAEAGTAVESWGPLAEGRNGFFQNELLAGIGWKYGKSIAQVVLRWLLQRGVIIIPRSTKQERMAQNLMLDDFTLSAEDMEQIKTLDTGRSILFDHHDGDTTKMFMGWRNIEDLYKQV